MLSWLKTLALFWSDQWDGTNAVGTASSCGSGHDGGASLAAPTIADSDDCTASSATGLGSSSRVCWRVSCRGHELLGKPVAFDGRERAVDRSSSSSWFAVESRAQCSVRLRADHGVPGLVDESEPRTAGRQCALLQDLQHDFPETREQPWVSSRCCLAGAACLERTSARASEC